MTSKYVGRWIAPLAAAVLSAGMSWAQAHDQTEITPVQVGEQLYMLQGRGGNIGLFVGADGTFLVDDQFAPLTEKIVAAVRSVGGEHPRFLINTHYHGDHTGGNENLGKGGTLIVSHHNVRERLSAGSFSRAFNRKSPPVPGPGLPVVTFSEDISFHINGTRVDARHVPHAHTDGDSFIHFVDANVIHAGDIFFNGFYPFIDVDHGGSLKGMIAAVERILALADDQTRIIPGHGPVGDKAALERYRAMLQFSYDKLRRLKEAGKTVAEAIAAQPLAELETEWGDGLFKGERWIELIYPGVY